MSSTKKLMYLSVLISMASVLHVFEGLLPTPFVMPGIKLGLANIITLVTLTVYGLKEGMIVAVMRVMIGSVLGGTFLGPTFLFSFSGALFSTVIMYLMLRYAKGFSIIGVSVVGAAAHNVAQLTTASLIVNTAAIFYYLPILLIFAVPTGVLTGLAVKNLRGYYWVMMPKENHF